MKLMRTVVRAELTRHRKAPAIRKKTQWLIRYRGNGRERSETWYFLGTGWGMDGRDVHRDRVKIRWFVHMLEFEVFTHGIYMYLLLNSCTCSQIIVKLPRRSIEQNSYEDECILTSVKALKWNESESCSVVSDSLRPHGLYRPWNSPGQNTGVGSYSLLQGIFLTQGSNSGLLPCRRILYQLSHKGSPRILEWVASPFSRGSTWPRNWTGVFCIAGRFFTNWAIREAPYQYKINHFL